MLLAEQGYPEPYLEPDRMRSGGQGLTDIMQHPPGAEGDPDNRDMFLPPPQQARPRGHLRFHWMAFCSLISPGCAGCRRDAMFEFRNK